MSDWEQRLARLERLAERMGRRIGAQFVLGRSTMAPDDSGVVQTVQAQFGALGAGEAIPILFHYGFGSVPPIGSDLHISFLEGSRSKAVVTASGNQTERLTGKSPGDAWMAGHGFSVVINAGGVAVTGPINQTGNHTITGTLTVHGNVVVTGGSITVNGVVVEVP